MFKRFVAGLTCLLWLCGAIRGWAEPPAARPLPETTPWNLTALREPPAFDWIDAQSGVRSLSYAGETYKERATKVFAFYASPSTLAGAEAKQPVEKFPGIVLVHGGGGTAFKEWAELWAKRGYAAIAMDLGGQHVGESGGPDQSDDTKFKSIEQPVAAHWPYHAVANVIRAHSLLRSLPEVDPDRTAITGISWGGYLTCIVASLDDRFRAAVPVYGCGFLHENSFWIEPQFNKLSPAGRQKWVDLYDPSRYLASCRVPMFFVNGTNDFAYPLDSYQKSYDLAPGEKQMRVTPNMPHGHSQGWAPSEIAAFVEHKLNGGPPLVKLHVPELVAGKASVAIASGTPAVVGFLHSTRDSGAINKRTWNTQELPVKEGRLEADLPAGATVWFFTAVDKPGRITSSVLMQADGKTLR